MKNSLKILLTLFFMLTIILGVTHIALASETFVTTDDVNMRRERSTNSEVIGSLSAGANVEVQSHDPAGWSAVSVNGATGFIRSDFLTLPAGTFPRTLRTTGDVNFRTEPSTESNLITTIGGNTRVEVLEHDPAGWSKVNYNGAAGYIRSDLLFRYIEGTGAQPSSNSSSGSMTLWTNAGVNFRESPSTDARIIGTVIEGTAVNVLEHNPTGWSKVRINGSTGYIRSDFLSSSNVVVELVEWSIVKEMLSDGQVIRVRDVSTGRSFNVRVYTRGRHADVDPVTRADSDILREISGGRWSWDRRPVWVTIGERTIAASTHSMPHGSSGVRDNGMNGHICIHFLGSQHHNGGNPAKHQAAVQQAYRAGQ